MKHFLKKLIAPIILFSIILINVSTNKSNWSSISLSPTEMQNSINFQLARGGTSKGEFEKIIPILNRFIANAYSAKNLYHILGEPDNIYNKASQTSYVYHLSASLNNCNLQLQIQNDALVSFTVSNCS